MPLIPRVRRTLGAVLVAAALITWLRPVLAASAQQPPPGFDAYVKRVMGTFTVPGLSVAIVKDGKVMLARGYGVRRMGDHAPVDAHTRFGIASNTKLRADAYATFSLKPVGSVEQLKIVPASDAVDFSFDFQDLVLKPVRDSATR